MYLHSINIGEHNTGNTVFQKSAYRPAFNSVGMARFTSATVPLSSFAAFLSTYSLTHQPADELANRLMFV